MEISEIGYTLIKRFEGLRCKAYQCSAGVWTIGYGHTYGVKRGDTITEKEADELLEQDLQYTKSIVESYVTVPLTQGMFNALCSFVFNVGAGAFKSSTLLRLLNAEQYDKAAREFDRWIYVNGKVSNGLKNRRTMERIVFELDKL